MARTYEGINDPRAVKAWSAALQVAVNKSSYFTKKFMGVGKRARTPLQRITDLESEAGDTVTIDLLMPMRMEPVIGDATLDGKEEALRYWTDKISIDQVRGGADLGGRMTRKRTLRDLRMDAKEAASEWWARLWDELFFIYLSGSRGTDTGFVWSADNPFFRVNPLTAPDSKHLIYGEGATSKATITNTSKMTLRLVDRLIAKSKTMGGDGTDELSMMPCKVNGEDKYALLMHPFQFDDLKNDTAATEGIARWLDIQKAAAAAEGQRNPIYTGSLGEYHGAVLHDHRNVIGFNDYGASANLPARRSLFLGAQAGMIAFGSSKGMSFDWTEEVKDHGDKVAIGCGSVFGVKKATYRSKDGTAVRDFGVIAVDTYAADPNPA